MQRKVDKIKGLLVACQGNEAKYVFRYVKASSAPLRPLSSCLPCRFSLMNASANIGDPVHCDLSLVRGYFCCKTWKAQVYQGSIKFCG